MRWLAIGGVGILLAACDDGSGARQALAQCKISLKNERFEDGRYHFGPILLCMQSKGYVEDNNLVTETGESCGPELWSSEIASCYRRDTDLDKWLVGARNKLSN